MATADTGSFRVHLQSLVDFARELENQLDALRRPADRLTVLGGRPLALGQFVPALPLAQRHAVTADQMQDLLVGVRHAVAFAEEVTRTIATEYARHDEQIAASFRSLGTGTEARTSDPVLAPGPAAATGAAPDSGAVFVSGAGIHAFAPGVGASAGGTVYVSQTARNG